MDGTKPKDIDPLISLASRRNKWSVASALRENNWIAKIKLDEHFYFAHMDQFIDLWVTLQTMVLHEEVEDTIHWTLSANGEYLATSEYKTWFLGAISNDMKKMVWKVWAPPKVKFFA